MSESIFKNDELENEMSSDMSYFWYSDVHTIRVNIKMHNIKGVDKMSSGENKTIT